ncbi:toxin-antitoxin system YwqK family antitoxin [Streptomyces monticola]|uniref:Toxin-antitoxin system YwqK family antitoxin n=1 Tax=Streptomyces monticola TaxID=2666263 RepID=A0ABW2JCZ6_9ACTN
MMTLARIDVDDPDVDMDEGERLLYRGALFTGEAVEYQQGALVSLDTYKDGVSHGPTNTWYPDGTLRTEAIMEEGFPVGESKSWHPNGTLASKRIMSPNGLRPLVEFEWDEDGNQTRHWTADAAPR